MRDYYTLKVNLPAGIVSPGTLQTLLKLAYEAKVRTVRFGARQQLLMTVHYEDMRFLEKDLKQHQITYELNSEQYPNIISSYCGEDVFRTGAWLRESEYHTVLDQFDYQPRLKVNLSDSNQSFTPFFTGNLNFIASPDPHFWYLYVRPKQTNTLFRWPELIYTNNIGRLAKAVEEAMLGEGLQDEELLYQAVTGAQSFITQPAVQEVELPEFSLPYYEGFNRYGQRSWLGLYRRDEHFSIAFLLDVCALCLKTRIGELCVTPWKSLIIKGIGEKDRAAWSYVLGKHNINVRHAANELAWQTEDHTDEGTELKNYVLRYFAKNDTRTFGLCFGVQTRPKSEVFGSVLVRKRPLLRLGQLALFSVYDIYCTENFNPNSRTYRLFEKGLFKLHLPNQLNRLCRKFNARRLEEDGETVRIDTEKTESSPNKATSIYQCPHCFTVYDEQYGDTRSNIPAGTRFDQLPVDYQCSTCDAPKAELRELTVELVS
ncbi:rubredoxin domain-containing protein [Spirosoma foliorum]|uniref:Rubredoxin domain-containing protein n=1 Tax=Spirosoma foliorum TaxID=2710596 RepID=A0A7G5GT76_9BACT|nr:rubredoxin domain-containing protein [Spirosoma foliorum]QMW02068.1 rubredoxin domain-containing protein [Spirosoma foliorum]